MGVASPAFAAVDITSLRGSTANALAGELVGSGVTLVSASFTGDPAQAGAYTGLDIGDAALASGVAISTGSLIDADPTSDADTDFTTSALAGPNSKLTTTGDFGGEGYAPLTTQAGATTYDAAVLTLQVVPEGDDLTLSYAFGSEEYAEWSARNYGDAFGIWVGDELCSVVGSGQPVGTQTINDSANSALYVANFSGRDPGTQYDTELNGFTTALTCSATVTAGAQTSITIAIADTIDGQLDSTAVIAAESIVSTPLVSPSPSPSPSPSASPTPSPSPSPSPSTGGTASGGNGGSGDLEDTGAQTFVPLMLGLGLLLAGALAAGATAVAARIRRMHQVVADNPSE